MVLQAEDIVGVAYSLLLNREPEPEALRHWSAALENGLSQEQFVQAVLASSEFRQKMGTAETHEDVDLIIPMLGRQLRVPASDRDLVPHLLQHRCWEPHLTRYLRRELKPSDVFLDAGANVGYFTVLCAPLVARVLAFEPVARNHRYCQSNIALNQLANVELHQLGLWHTEALVPLRGDSPGVNAAIAASPDSAGADSIRVGPFDTLVSTGRVNLSRLDVVKMDVEGAELSALQGMRDTLGRFRPRIVMELNPPMLATFGVTVDDIWTFLHGLQYDVQAFEPWKEQDPFAVGDLDELRRLCPSDGLIDIVATSSMR